MMSTAHAMPTLPIVSVTLPNGQQVGFRITQSLECGFIWSASQVHPGVEALILRFGLDAQCAQQLRQLPLQLQARLRRMFGFHVPREPA